MPEVKQKQEPNINKRKGKFQEFNQKQNLKMPQAKFNFDIITLIRFFLFCFIIIFKIIIFFLTNNLFLQIFQLNGSAIYWPEYSIMLKWIFYRIHKMAADGLRKNFVLELVCNSESDPLVRFTFFAMNKIIWNIQNFPWETLIIKQSIIYDSKWNNTHQFGTKLVYKSSILRWG